MIVLIKLLVAHFIGDFLLQPASWVIDKESKKAASSKLYIHVIIHGMLTLLLLWDLYYWLTALVITVTHGILDALKLYVQKENNKSKWFLIDQGLHIISIFVIWLIFLIRKQISRLGWKAQLFGFIHWPCFLLHMYQELL